MMTIHYAPTRLHVQRRFCLISHPWQLASGSRHLHAWHFFSTLFFAFTALDEIISARPKKTGAGRNNQRGRRGGRAGKPSAKAAAVGAGAQNAAVIAASNRNKPPVVIPGRSGNTGSKIILSNLPLDVTEAQVKVCTIIPNRFRKPHCGSAPTQSKQSIYLTSQRRLRDYNARPCSRGYCVQQELFATTIGPLRKAAMSYRANGQSTGVCTVEFQRADDAARAYSQYNNRLIDGSEYMASDRLVYLLNDLLLILSLSTHPH